MQTAYTTDIVRPLTIDEMVERRAMKLGVSKDEAARRLLGNGDEYRRWREGLQKPTC